MKFKIIFSVLILITSFAKSQVTYQNSDTSIKTYVEQMPEFPGGNKELTSFLVKNLQYPQAARDSGIEGRVVLQFVVDKNGKISDVKTLRDIGGGCAEEAARVVKMMPDWIPGKQNGTAVSVFFKLPVTFKLNETDLTVAKFSSPAYIGGEDSLNAFITRNVVYPKDAKKKKIQGAVTLMFIVDENGNATDVSVYKGLGFGCDEEAIRICSLIKQWTPGTKEGRKVPMPYYMVVEFKLPGKK